MEHKERYALGMKILNELVKIRGADLVYGGIYGSTASGKDKKYSDLELVFITKKEMKDQFFLYEGIPILLQFSTKKELLKMMEDVRFNFVFELGHIMTSKRVYGDRKVVDEIKQEYKKTIKNQWKHGAKNSLVHAYEFLCKIRNAQLYGKNREVIYVKDAAVHLSFCLNAFIAFVNKKYYLSGEEKSLNEAKDFKNLPKSYLSLSKKMLLSNEIKDIYKTAEKLWENSIALAKSKDVYFTSEKRILLE